ncbi:MAG: glycosyl transferase family 2 [Candidatus Synechococcus spongiarum 15L]|uniref:Glycosyl transferase family 2 n=2 Tax=Candidatus Synechococcus spongiarum TaxID=431041 RepID=A0A1T1D2M9_9SYNE|nr:HEAT repeat domain-containing protein [Candidatus Synechococcus spongiarum]KKZ12967.1 MAG: glycosyl transferase family 2 [Candidatus Synechococcus spongiarum 15L]OOV35129.1 glycosyl transferase family 2 [Candidatus Synechococcus spongiarum LMB bulk15N]
MSQGTPLNEAQALDWLRQLEDPGQRYYAAWWLGRMRSNHPEAVPLLIQALTERGPRPDPASGIDEPNPVARNAARALGKLADSRAVDPLLAALEFSDDGLREAAARSLGQLGALKARQAILRRLAPGPLVAGAPRPGTSRLTEPCEALLEALGALGWQNEDGSTVTDRKPLLEVVQAYVDHERPLIRSAAYRSLLQLTQEDCWGEQLVNLLLHNELQVRRAALLDLGVTGWRPAGAAVAGTLAENSLKLIALRGLVENSPARNRTSPSPSPEEVGLLLAMDDLL